MSLESEIAEIVQEEVYAATQDLQHEVAALWEQVRVLNQITGVENAPEPVETKEIGEIAKEVKDKVWAMLRDVVPAVYEDGYRDGETGECSTKTVEYQRRKELVNKLYSYLEED